MKKKGGGVFSKQQNPKLSDDLAQMNDATTISNIPTVEALDIGLSILKNTDLRQLAPTCPEHWLFTEYDRLIPKEVINDLLLLRPDTRITLLEKMGHAPFITHPDFFLNHVIDFIEAQPST